MAQVTTNVEESGSRFVENLEELSEGCSKLSDAQRARMERNRQKALSLKQTLRARHPYQSPQHDHKMKKKLPPKLASTEQAEGGFLLEEDTESDHSTSPKVIHPKGAILAPDYTQCDECGKSFIESYLLEMFDVSVCNSCRDNDEKHKLMTKSDAKQQYLLKDADLDRREPPLKFAIKKNPRNEHWGDMKLYLGSQVLQRAMDVWGSEEKLEEKREELQVNREKLKQKRYDKKVKNLRLAVRSSLWRKDIGPHEHVYGPEVYNDDDDVYNKTCTTCGHIMSYEKM